MSTADIPEDFEISEPVFIDFDELPVPFFIEEFKPHGTNKAFIKFEDIDSLQDAEEIVGKEISFGAGTDEDFAGFTGLQIFDVSSSRLAGTVTEYIDIPSNPCLEVRLTDSDKTILIPCHEDLIDRIDENNGRIYMKLPEGLL